MSVRQYIGARYVTKVYENSLDPSSAEWEAGVTYEPLTLVTYLNSSYLSKKDVPGSVGDPAANPTYWVVTGAYNGQIATLQAQIDAINATLAKKFVVISDSYGGYTNSDGRNAVEQAFYNLDITDSYQFYRNSSGFGGTGSLNFLSVLQDNESAITDKDQITDIIVLGSANDQVYYADIESGIAAFTTYVKANYQNAKIHIGCVSRTYASSYLSTVSSVIDEYRRCASKYGISYIDNSEYIMMRLTYFQNDNVHPTTAGVDAIAKYLTQFLLNGHFDVSERITSVITSGTNATVSNVKLHETQHNGNVSISGDYGGEFLTFVLNNSVSLSAGVTLVDNIGTYTDGFLISTLFNNISLNVKLYITGGYIDANLFFNTIGNSMAVTMGLLVVANSSSTLSDAKIVGSTGTVSPLV